MNWYRSYAGGSGALSIATDTARSTIYRRHLGTGVNQVATFGRELRLPPDFQGFESVAIDTRRVGASDAFTLQLLSGATADPSINAVSILPVGTDWEKFAFTPSGTYAAGDYLLHEISSTVDSTEENHFADLRLTYRSRGGARTLMVQRSEENLEFSGTGTRSRVYDTTGRFTYTQHASSAANSLMTFTDHVMLAAECKRLQSITLGTYRSGAVDFLRATLQVDGATDLGVNAVSVSPSGSAAWEPFTLTPAGVYTAGARALLILESQIDNTLQTRHRDILWNYTA